MRVKKERFVLKMKDNVEVRNLDEFREHFELGHLHDYAGDGTLLKWLELWRYADEADEVRALNKSDADYQNKLCAIFGIDTEEMKWRKERLERLKKFTKDEGILKNVDNVAFDTEELYDLLDEGLMDIYICNNEFRFPSGVLREKNRHYHGIGDVKVIIESKEVINFDSIGLTFEGIKFNEPYQKMINKDNVIKPMSLSESLHKNNIVKPASLSEILQAAYKAYTEKNYVKALELYKKASESGNVTAMCMVGDIYFSGGYGIGIDREKSKVYYQKAANEGDYIAIEKLKKFFKICY